MLLRQLDPRKVGLMPCVRTHAHTEGDVVDRIHSLNCNEGHEDSSKRHFPESGRIRYVLSESHLSNLT